eukprot:15472477-Alexandrium_andersonii.AAC.3
MAALLVVDGPRWNERHLRVEVHYAGRRQAWGVLGSRLAEARGRGAEIALFPRLPQDCRSVGRARVHQQRLQRNTSGAGVGPLELARFPGGFRAICVIGVAAAGAPALPCLAWEVVAPAAPRLPEGRALENLDWEVRFCAGAIAGGSRGPAAANRGPRELQLCHPVAISSSLPAQGRGQDGVRTPGFPCVAPR